MNEYQLNRVIVVLVVVIATHYVLELILPYLIYGTAGLVIWRVYLFNRNRKQD